MKANFRNPPEIDDFRNVVLKREIMRHLLTLGLLIAAFALYDLGAEKGSTALIFIGVCFEVISWKRMRSPKTW